MPKTPTTKVTPTPKPKAKVTLVSYAIKMTIPTGQYANIQPEIVVKTTNVEDAHDYIAPHMNKLWKEYYLCNERRPEVKPKPAPPAPAPVITPVAPVAPVAPAPAITPATAPAVDNTARIVGALTEPVAAPAVAVQAPPSSVAYTKANQAIESCLSVDALKLISDQVVISTKLTEEDKELLLPLMEAKYKILDPK